MKNLIITQAQKEDLPAILDVQKKAFTEVARIFNLKTMPHIEQPLESITDEFNKWIFLNASLIDLKPTKKLDSRFRGNDTCAKIVGSLRAYKNEDTCYIHRLVVLPEYQNKGIGKALMAEVEKRFQDKVARYELFTGSQDHRNLYLYNQLGYNALENEKHGNTLVCCQ